MSEYAFPAENPPVSDGYVLGRNGKAENPRTRAAIETMRHNPNTWYRIDEIAYENGRTQVRMASRGQALRKKASKEGLSVQYTSRRVGTFVRLYGRVVVEG